MCCRIGHDPYSRVVIDQRRVNGSEPLYASKHAQSKFLSRSVKHVKDRWLLTVEMKPREDLQPTIIFYSILVRIKPQYQIVKRGRGRKDQRPR